MISNNHLFYHSPGAYMLGIVFLLMLAAFIYFLFSRSGILSKMEERFEARGYGESHDPFALRPSRRDRTKKAPIPVIPELPFESNRCEVCGSQPLRQYTNKTTGSILEFCGHHAKKHQDSLFTKGYKLTLSTD